MAHQTSLFPRTIDGITYDILKPGEEAAVAKVAAEDFCLHEPLSQTMKVPREATIPLMTRLCRHGIEAGVSLKAIDDATGEIAAVRVSFLKDKAKTDEDDALYEEVMEDLVPESVKPFVKFYEEAGGEAGKRIFETYNIDRYVEFFFVNVRKEYRGRQIAQRILQACYDLYKEMGITLIKVLASNPATAHIFRDKQGFKEIANYKVLDFMHDGKPYFAGVREDAVQAPTFIKILD